MPKSVDFRDVSRATTFGHFGCSKVVTLPTQGIAGRSAAGVAFKVKSAGFRPAPLAIKCTSPALASDCTITCASPLNNFRWAALSGSCDDGFPFPTPIIFAGPLIAKSI